MIFTANYASKIHNHVYIMLNYISQSTAIRLAYYTEHNVSTLNFSRVIGFSSIDSRCIFVFVTVALKFGCEDTPDGYYSHPSYCTMYQECDNGRGFLLPCPAGLYWEDAQKTCVKAGEASCLKYTDDLL